MKYKNVKTEVDGRRFDSKAEAARYRELKVLEDVGEITDLKTQVPFLLIHSQVWKDGHKSRPVKYIADFVYREGGRLVVEDVKGFKTDVYKLKKALMKEIYNIEIREVKA